MSVNIPYMEHMAYDGRYFDQLWKIYEFVRRNSNVTGFFDDFMFCFLPQNWVLFPDWYFDEQFLEVNLREIEMCSIPYWKICFQYQWTIMMRECQFLSVLGQFIVPKDWLQLVLQSLVEHF